MMDREHSTEDEGTFHLRNYVLDGELLEVDYVENQKVKEGVECDIYVFTDDETRDLAIVRVDPGSRTPLQRVLSGTRTLECYQTGSGRLTVIEVDGKSIEYIFPSEDGDLSVTIEVGQIMQWTADADSVLTFSEVCYPPYQEGRFEDLDLTR